MTEDRIAEIRARHEVDAKIATVLNPELPPTWTLAGWRAHDDRATLLAEVERQARHIEELREKIDAERSCACSFDAPGDVCAAHSPALTRARAEVEKLRADNEKLRSALKPFAVEAEAYDPPEKDDEDDAETAWFSFFTCGNLRDARRALEQAASDDKIKNIKNPLLTDPDAWFVDKSDRSFLLAEVDSQRAENELQRAEIELQRTSRHREARAFEAEHNRLQAALNTARRERDEARAEVEDLRDETGRLQSNNDNLTLECGEARAEVERLRAALRDALDGLRYWVPQTSVGAVEKCRIVEKGIEALEAKP